MAADSVFDADYRTFIRHARRLIGVDLTGYKPEQMRRRLLALAGRHGATTLTGFANVIEKNPEALAAFKNFFTINVSEFLRDPLRWRDLQEKVVPRLLSDPYRSGRPFHVWSAGCSYGAEPYSLAILLQETMPGRPYTITGTDIDETVLTKARQGCGYQEADLRNISAERRARFFVRAADGTWGTREELKRRTRFLQQDLLRQTPGRDMDLIVCRNVVIYFTEAAKRDLYERLSASLRPGGVLFVGGTEFVNGARELGLEQLMPSFYRRPPALLAGAA